MPSVVEPSFGIGRIMYCLFEHAYYAREKDAQRTVFRFSPLVAPTKATVFPLVQKAEMNSAARQISDSLRKGGVSNIIDTTGKAKQLFLIPRVLSVLACTRNETKVLGNACCVTTTNLAGTTVGKRYARTDELGVPFGITVDGQTAEDKTVTVRERDSTKQACPPPQHTNPQRPVQGQQARSQHYELPALSDREFSLSQHNGLQVRVPVSELVPLLQQLSSEQLLWKDLKYPEVKGSTE